MIQQISTPVSVNLNFDYNSQTVSPKYLVWGGKFYPIVKIGLHHTYCRGKTLYHVFSVASQTLFFRLVLNTDSLHWTLEEISDGLPD